MAVFVELVLIFAGALSVVWSAVAAGSLIAPGTELPRVVRFTTGAIAVSLCIFTLLTLHAGYVLSYAAMLIVFSLAFWRMRARIVDVLPPVPAAVYCLFGLVTGVYLIVVLSPEVQPDALAYHLRLARDYVRLHAFTGRIEFFDVMPQGAQMLFVPAVAIGGFQAAKLVHFAFLLSTIPLIRHLAREFGLPDRVGVTAAALFFLSPVAAIDGTCAYVDMMLVCACTSVLYLLVRWCRERSTGLLVCAALNAGFCYCVKPTFGWIAIAGTLFIAVQSRKWRPASIFAAVAALPIAPWVIRAYVLTGDPAAPFLTRVFPNESSAPAVEYMLTHAFSAFRPEFSWMGALPSYALLGGNQGLLGIAFLLLPVALLALRKPAGRWLAAAAFILAIPALANTGTRFLLPALIPAALALSMLLPSPLALALVCLQLIAATPQAMDLYEKRGDWRLRQIPLRAALRQEPEAEYLARTLFEMPLVTMLNTKVHSGARVLTFPGVADAYVTKDHLVYWHSATGMRLMDALQFATVSAKEPPAQYAVNRSAGQNALRIHSTWELRVVDVNAPVRQSWQTHAPQKNIDYALRSPADFAALLIWPSNAPVDVELRDGAGHWAVVQPSKTTQPVDLRRDVAAYLSRKGFGYILIPSENDAFAPVGQDMLHEPDKWGVRPVDHVGSVYLFEILDKLVP